MKRTRRLAVGFVALSVAVLQAAAGGGVISGINVNNSTRTYTLTPDAMGDGATAYTDRAYTWQTVPAYLVGQDYVQTPNEDRGDGDLSIDVTLSQAGTLYAWFDDRPGEPSWATAANGWSAAGDFITLGGGSNETFSVYHRPVAAGAHVGVLGPAEATNRAMYGFAAAPGGPPTRRPMAVAIAHWAFDQVAAGTTPDATGNGHDATVVGAAHLPAGGVFGGAMSLNGTSDYIEAADDPAFEFATGRSFSAAVWFKADPPYDDPTNDGLITKGYHDSSRDDPYYLLQINGDGDVAEFDSRNTIASQRASQAGTTRLTDGQWHHVACVRDSELDQILVYVDGELEGTYSGGDWTMGANPDPLVIGNHFNRFTQGVLDEAWVFDGALSQADVVRLMARNQAPEVPEPATMALLGLAACGLGGYVRRRRGA